MSLETVLAHFDPGPGETDEEYVSPSDIKAAFTDLSNLVISTFAALPVREGPTGPQGPPGLPGVGVLALGVADEIPYGTPAGTVIVRYEKG